MADAIDTVTSKIELIPRCRQAGVPVISAMGAGNKLDPTRFQVADIFETSVCPLCRVMRRELKKRGFSGLKVVYSQEEPAPREEVPGTEDDSAKRQTPGSLAFVPSVVVFILPGKVMGYFRKDLPPPAG